MIRWLRVVWPPGWALAWALFLYLGFEGFFLFMEWSLDIPFYSFPEVGRLPTGMMGIMVALYAIYRIWGFHPHARPPYSQWLATTVWNAEKALPLGPVHLVWQDALLIVIAAGLCWPRAQASALLVPLAFAAAYVVSLAVVNTSVGEKHWSYVIAFWFGIMALAWGNVPIFAATIVVGYGLAYCGLRRSLRRFPWDGQPNIISPAYQDAKKNKLVGWPYDHLGPEVLRRHPDRPKRHRNRRRTCGLVDLRYQRSFSPCPCVHGPRGVDNLPVAGSLRLRGPAHTFLHELLPAHRLRGSAVALGCHSGVRSGSCRARDGACRLSTDRDDSRLAADRCALRAAARCHGGIVDSDGHGAQLERMASDRQSPHRARDSNGGRDSVKGDAIG